MSGGGGHTHRGDGALVERQAAATRDEPARATATPASNGFVAAWARAVRARRAAPPSTLEPRQFTAAPATPVDNPRPELAAAPAPPAAVRPGAGSPWLRRVT